MARRTRSNLDAPTPADLSHASGSARCPDARCVDLVWRDPVTGEHLSLGLEASPALIASLREDGFLIAEGGGASAGSANDPADGSAPDAPTDAPPNSGGSGSTAAA